MNIGNSKFLIELVPLDAWGQAHGKKSKLVAILYEHWSSDESNSIIKSFGLPNMLLCDEIGAGHSKPDNLFSNDG